MAKRKSRKPRPRTPYAREPRPVTAQPTTDATAQPLGGAGYRRRPILGYR